MLRDVDEPDLSTTILGRPSTLPIALAPTLLGAVGWIYGAPALALSVLFIFASLRVLVSDGHRPARQMFAYSILYLFLLFALMLADRLAA